MAATKRSGNPFAAAPLDVSARELAAVILFSAFVMVLTAIPYAWAIRLHPDMYFAGFIWGVDEGNVYLSWIRQASEGRLLLANQYTTKLQRPHFFNVFLIGAGLICRLTHLQPVQVFHILRWLGIPFALVCFYLLVSYFTAVRLVRGAAVVIAGLCSGLGWVAWLLTRAGRPLELYPMDVASGWQVMPEAVTFLSFLLNPLFTWSIGLMCLFLWTAARAFEAHSFRLAAAAGSILLLLGNVHSYDIFACHLTAAAWAAYMVLRGRLPLRRAAALYGIIFAISAASPIWAYWAAHSDPAYMAKVNTPTLSPRLRDYAMGYGLLVPAALLGLAAAWLIRRFYWRPLLAGLWLLAHLVLVYAPVPFQRKMIEGAHLPLSFLAAMGVALALPWLVERRWPWQMSPNARWWRRRRVVLGLVGLFVVACMPSNVAFVADCMEHMAANNAGLFGVLMPPAYLTAGEMAAMQWLAKHTKFDDIVLSSSLIGNHIPAHAPCRVFAGHWAETIGFADCALLISKFYAPGTPPGLRVALLRETGASYVWWGQYEVALQKQMVPVVERVLGAAAPIPFPPDVGLEEALRPVFSAGGVTIYRVNLEG